MIVLDTHALLWWASGSRKLSLRARRTIEASSARGVAAITLWEICMLVARGRVELDREPAEWLEQALAIEHVELLPLTPAIAARSTTLGPEFHADPADQQIVATALVHGARLVTRDERIAAWRGVATVW